MAELQDNKLLTFFACWDIREEICESALPVEHGMESGRQLACWTCRPGVNWSGALTAC